MPNLDKHGFGSNPIPLIDKQTLIDNYNTPFPMSSKLGYKITYSEPVLIDEVDKTVVANAYDTSGNGGRKLVKLSNGTLISVLKENSTTYGIYLYKNGSWNRASSNNVASGMVDIALVSNGLNAYLIISSTGSGLVTSFKINSLGSLSNGTTVDSGQSTLGNCSLAINEQGTELHATWSSKNSTYANSFNIRYCKGIINLDGSVTWGSVEQVTTYNTVGDNQQNPSIFTLNNNPYIIVNGTNIVGLLTKGFTTKDSSYFNGYINSNWGSKMIYQGNGYAQSNPSAIYVPKEINGLVNGRIWVVWHGSYSANSGNHIMVSCSDDKGLTWVAKGEVQGTFPITSGYYGSFMNPTITANKDNEIHVVYQSSLTQYRKRKFSGDAWSSPSSDFNGSNPSTYFDISSIYSQNFSSPLFIYQGSNKVGFYGTWNNIIITELVDYSSVNLKNLIQTINSSGRLGHYTNKRWAKGSLSVGKITSDTSQSVGALFVGGLSFTPSYVFVNYTPNGSSLSAMCASGLSSNGTWFYYGSGGITSDVTGTYPNYKFIKPTSNWFYISPLMNTNASALIEWIAFE